MRRAASLLVLLAACDTTPHVTVRKTSVYIPPTKLSPAVAGPPTLTVRADGVDLAWNGMTLHLANDCGTIGAALDTSHPDSLTIVADSATPYAAVVAIMDCVKSHVANIQLETR